MTVKDCSPWQEFSKLVQKVKKDHIRHRCSQTGGHCFVHTVMVAQYGKIITEEDHIGTLAWIAGICHNTDRLFPESKVENKTEKYLELCLNLSRQDKDFIIKAVLGHSELNHPNDNPVAVALKDADRLANAGAIALIRCSQHRWILPVFNPDRMSGPDPKATFSNPRTVLDALYYTLEWESMLRLPKAKKLGKPLFEFLRKCIENLRDQIREIELCPKIFELL